MSKLSDINESAAKALRRRSLITTPELEPAELHVLLEVAAAFERLERAGTKTDFLSAELAYALFFDQSTRTKSAWAGAASRLGMQPVIVDGGSTQVSHGETAVETGAMLGMNSHAIGVRHDLILGQGTPFIRDIDKGIRDYLAGIDASRNVPIVNLQCDLDHPTQTLADAAWLTERFGSLEGKKIAVTWAYSPSYAKPLSVPQGLIMLLPRLGANVSLAAPEGYGLMDTALDSAKQGAAAGGGSFQIADSMEAAFEGADVVYPKSWGPLDLMLERVEAKSKGQMADIERRALERNAQYKNWICDEAKMAKTAGGDALYMHCLPADIGAEVSVGVMEKHRLNLAREAQKKVFVIMALLALSKMDDAVERLSALGA